MSADRIGERLRRYRRAAKKTLNQVAAESGLTASFLSQAERNLTGVSLSSLASIAKALDVPLNALFDSPQQIPPDSHQGERVRYTIEGQPLSYERLSSSFPGNQLNAVKVTVPVGYESELITHDGSEFAYVLSGRIAYVIDGHTYPLAPGDSIHFDSGKRHCLRNTGEEVAEMLPVTTLPLFGEQPAG